MIPWVRGKFAERRARWLATRKQTSSPSPFTSQQQQQPQQGGASSGTDVDETLLPDISVAEATTTRVLNHSSFDIKLVRTDWLLVNTLRVIMVII